MKYAFLQNGLRRKTDLGIALSYLVKNTINVKMKSPPSAVGQEKRNIRYTDWKGRSQTVFIHR